MKWYELNKKYLWMFFIVSILSLLYVFPIILVNIYFKDDLGWSLAGEIGLKGDGRPLGEYLVHALCGGRPVTDTAPLPLILLVLFLSYTLVLYVKTNLDFVSDHYALIAVLLFVITNPLAVECVAYRYGSMVMFVALGIPFIIFSIPDTISRAKIFIYSMILSIALMCLYQPTLGMCLVLLINNIFFAIIHNRKLNYISEGVRIAGIGVGAVLYKIIIPGHYINTADWRYEASQTLELKPGSIIKIIENMRDSCLYIGTFLSETALWYRVALALIIIIAVASIVLFYHRESKKTGWRKAIDIAFLIVSPIAVFFASFLPMLLLKTLSMKGRLFIALGGFLLYIGIFLLYHLKRSRTFALPLSILIVLCILYPYTYMYSFGNALNNQNEYAKYIVYNIAHDLETINADGEYTTVTFIGKMPRTKRIQMLYDKYPSYESLLPRYITNDTWIGGAYVLHYLQDDLKLESDNESDIQVISSEEPVMTNSLYSCYLNGDKIIVSFRESSE